MAWGQEPRTTSWSYARGLHLCSVLLCSVTRIGPLQALVCRFFLFQLRLLSSNCVFHCSNRVIGRLFRRQVGSKEYSTNQNVRLRCAAHCVGHRQNASGPATTNGRFSYLRRLAFAFRSPNVVHTAKALAADRACVFRPTDASQFLHFFAINTSFWLNQTVAQQHS
jgi:hypothetical protein